MGFLGIPGLSFSLKRAVGVTKVKQKIARKTGIPTTRQGRQAKIGRSVSKGKFGTALAVGIVNSFLGK
ncbi:MAG: hypothetical protein LBO69_01475 [Ignavibacteria bacterium]|jgi:hypothetical protein|nr:hypothetical protein [Ignavibacteria bacterium]